MNIGHTILKKNGHFPNYVALERWEAISLFPEMHKDEACYTVLAVENGCISRFRCATLEAADTSYKEVVNAMKPIAFKNRRTINREAVDFIEWQIKNAVAAGAFPAVQKIKVMTYIRYRNEICGKYIIRCTCNNGQKFNVLVWEMVEDAPDAYDVECL